MRRPRYTNKIAKWRGDTVLMHVRVMRPVADLVDSAVGQDDLPNRAAVLQDALALWAIGEEDNG